MIGTAQSALHADEAVADFSDAVTADVAGTPVEQTLPDHKDGYLSIGDAAAALNLPAHVLRYWETQFDGLQPLKRSGGRRFYGPTDIAFLQRLRSLLHEQAYTIRGAQRLLAEERAQKISAAVSLDEPMTPQALQNVLERAVEAGAFDTTTTSLADIPSVSPVASERLRDALDLLVEAKARLDAARRAA